MGKFKEELQKIYDECTKIYTEDGAGAVIDFINEHQEINDPAYINVQYQYCTGCNEEMPVLNHVCLICGSAVHAEIGRKITTIAEVRELIADLNDDDIAVLEACDENGDVEDLYPMYIDVIEGIELLNGKTVNEVRFCQMPNNQIKLGTGILDENKNEIKIGDTVPDNETKTVLVCPNCKSDNVQVMMWVNANTNEVIDSAKDDGDDDWCDDCRTHLQLDSVTLKPSAKVIGFQVVGEEHSEEEGNIHPDMDASFCVYNLQQAREMLTNDNWRLLAIWEGDVEKPTMMFEGNPRN